MGQKKKLSRFKVLATIVFLGFALWWVGITIFLRHGDHSGDQNQVFAATYGVMALLGGIIGLVASRRWGGAKSLLGRSLLFFSLGLFAQEFGQLAYSYYLYVSHIQIPYPSIGDIGYFGSVLLYIYAVWLMFKSAGAKFSLKHVSKKMIAILLPVVLLAVSYVVFLRGYHFDFSTAKATLTVVLDFGYPLGQALYIAIALTTYLLSRGLLGGIMKNRVMLILFALMVQYAADFSFLLAARDQKVFPAGANDFVYLLSYTVMALALNSFRFNLDAETTNVTSDGED